MNSCSEDGIRLLRYLDNELSGQELEDFRAHLQTCGHCKAQLAEEQALSGVLKRSRPLYAAPEELRARVAAIESANREGLYQRIVQGLKQSLHGSQRPIFSWKVLAPAVLAIVLCLVFVPDLVQQARAASYVETAVSAHRSYLIGDLIPDIQSDSPEVVTEWLAGRLSFRFRLPMSQAISDSKPLYRLTGASVVKYQESQVALVTYAREHEKISLLIAPSKSAVVAGGDEIPSGNLVFHYRSADNFKVITWSTHGLSYALVTSLAASARESCLVCHQHMADHETFKSQR